ncbi:MAG: Gfo/Idh/MocA family oxidoreductase [Betaproteobacteria bacterium]|nr:Gfo/Idh/MocA family oxidoreductase [Betaproteobacteria bacterium]
MLNVAIVGLGRWGQRLVDSVTAPKSAKLRFTHAVARTPDKVRAYCEERGIPLGSDFARVLDDPSVAAVALATPHSQHADQVIAAARAGKHVFVEKPLALDAASARAMARACRERGVVLAPGQNRRFLPAVAEIKRMVAAGELGTILHLEGNFTISSGLRYDSSNWRANQVESPGGGMTGQGIHVLDGFIHIAGAVSSVRCESERRVVKVDMDDTTSLFARFAGGATAYLSTITATRKMYRMQVFGTGGWAHLLSERVLETCEADGKVKRVEFPEVDIERAELEAFADAVAGTASYPVPVEEVIHGIAVFEAAMRSAKSGGERIAVESAAP